MSIDNDIIRSKYHAYTNSSAGFFLCAVGIIAAISAAGVATVAWWQAVIAGCVSFVLLALGGLWFWRRRYWAKLYKEVCK